jgi:phenylpropionate dioxygenase-like ring-hydroxylating dioxygenase large terminal subunit
VPVEEEEEEEGEEEEEELFWRGWLYICRGSYLGSSVWIST